MRPDKGVPVSPMTGVPGWEEDEEELSLAFYASQVPKGGLIVEIGTEYGRSAATFLAATMLADVNVISIDLFPKDHPVVGDLFEACTGNLREAKLLSSDLENSRWAVLKTSSHDAAGVAKAGWDPQQQIDLLFIDGDHTYEGVKQDITDWWGFVKPGGVIAFHDVAIDESSHSIHFEVRKAVEELITPDIFAFEIQVHSLRIYRRIINEPSQ
jgi:predicted O-methyltransferase YrrM